MAVIGDLEKLETPIFDEDFERGGASVNGVFHELFKGVDRCNDNFSCCNLVYDIWMECLNCVRITFCHRNVVMGTFILLGAETSNGTSSAFLFVPDGASELSRSMESILGKRLKKIKGGMVAVFKRALHKEALAMHILIRPESSRHRTTVKTDGISQM